MSVTYRFSSVALAVLFAACGGRTVVTPVIESVATGPSWNPRSLAPTEVPGVMAFAHLNIPDGNLPLVVTGDGSPTPTGTLLQAYGGLGVGFEVRAESQKQYRYGCDGGSTLMQEFTATTTGTDIPTGVAWLVAQPVPDWMAIEAVPIETDSTRVTRDITAGPLHITQRITGATQGEMIIEADGHELDRQPFEFSAMAGYETEISLDLRNEEMQRVPMPVAVWLLAPEGPALMAVRVNGFEGFLIITYLIGATTVDGVESLTRYLYSCAA